MKVLVDTNLFLDVLFERDGLADDSQAVLDWCGENRGNAYIAWHTVANLYYIGTKSVGKTEVMPYLDAILSVFEVSPVDSHAARTARSLNLSDFEDALQAAAALTAEADFIVTRNQKDFRNSPVKAITPSAFLKIANGSGR
ncbi:MAG: PIN domain-containing protein [Verrucomicrobiae bacterium]|nr:PIN domain-containing protein [Verrucomicrobiae bacterium]